MEENQQQFRDRLISAYDRHAMDRENATTEPWKLAERESFLRLAQSKNLSSTLEIGSGPGRDAKFFQSNGLAVTCIDLSPQMVSLCRDKGLDAHVMDFAELSFADNSFDAIWALNCLLHVPKAELPTVLSELRRVLRSGGLFYMGVYGGVNSEGIWDGDSYEPKRFFSFFANDDLRAIVEEFFTVVSFKTLSHSKDLVYQAVVMSKET